MSCPSKSARKRKLQTSECEKPAKKKMAWDSYTSVKDFGYEFNEEGRLVDIGDGNGFNFYVSDEHWYNQKNYEMLGEVITEYVYELLQSEDVGLKMLEIPMDKKNKESAKGFIFVSEDFDKKEKLLVLVHGSGVVRAGQWARRLIINDCLDHGTQIPYIKKAIKEGYGVVVTNTNQNEAPVDVKGKKTYKTIKESESPERHFSYVWKNVIEKTTASKIFAVAHSYGGYLVVNYFSRFPKILERAVAVAFTDSVHSLNSDSKANVRKWFLNNSVNWVTSNDDLDTPMFHQDDKKHLTRVSAGTTKHEESSWKAMESVFKYFQNQEVDFNKLNDGKKKKGGKSGAKPSKQGKKLAPTFTNVDRISKKSNSEESQASDILIVSESLKCGDSSGQSELSEDKEETCTSEDGATKIKEEAKSTNQKPGDSSEASDLEVTSEEKAKKIEEEASKLKQEENSKQDGMNDYIESKQKPANNTEDTSEGRAKEIKEQEKSSASKSVVSSEQDVMNASAETRPEVSVNVEGTGEGIVKVKVLAKDAKDIHDSKTITENQNQPTKPDEVQKRTNEKGIEKSTSKEQPNLVKVKVLAKDAKNIHDSKTITENQKDNQPTKPDEVQKSTNEKGIESKEQANSETNNVEEPSNKQNDAFTDSSSSKHEESVKADDVSPKQDNVDKKSNGEEENAHKTGDTSPPDEAGSKSDQATHDADSTSENHPTDSPNEVQETVV